jgi:hypothetical protein
LHKGQVENLRPEVELGFGVVLHPFFQFHAFCLELCLSDSSDFMRVGELLFVFTGENGVLLPPEGGGLGFSVGLSAPARTGSRPGLFR